MIALPVDRAGVVDMEALEAALTRDTILVSVMYVNNEIGSVEPVAEIGAKIREKAPGADFHVDAIQAFGKYRFHPKRMNIDMLSASRHSIHGPKGAGLLYVNEKVNIRPLIPGGGQQGGMRSGTDNVPGAAGMAALAAKLSYENRASNVSHMREMRERLAEGIGGMERVVIHGMASGQGAPHILNASFLGIRSEVLLHALEDRGNLYFSGKRLLQPQEDGKRHACGDRLQPGGDGVRRSVQPGRRDGPEEIDYTLEVLKVLRPRASALYQTLRDWLRGKGEENVSCVFD